MIHRMRPGWRSFCLSIRAVAAILSGRFRCCMLRRRRSGKCWRDGTTSNCNRTNLRTGAGMVANPRLFPGRNAAKHLDPQTKQMRLHNRGMSVLGARNSALQNLAAEIPPPVVAHLLGYSHTCTTTTHNWRLSPGRATSLSDHERVLTATLPGRIRAVEYAGFQ